jgi:hypothetical protein
MKDYVLLHWFVEWSHLRNCLKYNTLTVLQRIKLLLPHNFQQLVRRVFLGHLHNPYTSEAHRDRWQDLARVIIWRNSGGTHWVDDTTLLPVAILQDAGLHGTAERAVNAFASRLALDDAVNALGILPMPPPNAAAVGGSSM